MARTPRVKANGKGKGAKLAATSKEIVATINMHKRLHGVTFKKRAPRAIREIKAFAATLMGTSDVKINADVNKGVWRQGIRNVPRRVRLSFAREKDADSSKMLTTVSWVDDQEFKGALTIKKA